MKIIKRLLRTALAFAFGLLCAPAVPFLFAATAWKEDE